MSTANDIPGSLLADWSHYLRGDFAIGQRTDYITVAFGSFATVDHR